MFLKKLVLAAALTAFAGAAVAQDTAEPSAEAEAPVVQEMTMGAEDAPVTVIEYASFTCPHCAAFHDEVLPQFKADYVDTGKVRFVYREVYFDRYGLWAGIVARCGGPESYFGISDMIYDQQRDWVQGDATEIVEHLRKIGKTAGLTDAELDQCLTDAGKAEALYSTFVANADADGIEATPSFVIDGQTYRNMPYDDLKALLDEKIAAAE